MDMAMEIKINSKAVEKLIDVTSKGCGILYEPTRIRRKAKAEADAEIIKISTQIRAEEMRAAARTLAERREERRIENIGSIVSVAQQFLPESVSETPVDPDWAASFFNSCQDVSQEQMQEIWAKILAGEVSKPGTYSLKTLEVLKALRKSDAELFSKACNYIARFYHGSALAAHAEEYLEKKGLSFKKLRLLNDLGLIDFTAKEYSFEKGKKTLFGFGGKYYVLSISDKFFGEGFRPLPPLVYFYDLTIAGLEIFSLCKPVSDDEYRVLLLEEWSKKEIITEEIATEKFFDILSKSK